MSALKDYLEELHRIRASGLATDETSYYPALDGLFKAIGGELTPAVGPVHQLRDLGTGHPDLALQAEESKDVRAAVEAKGPEAEIAAIADSAQVRRYLTQYDPTLVTNLREFALTISGPNGQPQVIMRQTLAASADEFWRTPVQTLAARHARDLTDMLTTVMLWNAQLTRPRDLASALARYARNALARLEAQPAEALAPLRDALADALGLRFTDAHGEHFFRSSLVQTLFYGLFSAWVVWNRQGAPGGREGFRWAEAGDYLSLPVLRELFESVRPGQLRDLDIRQPLEWAATTLRHAGWERFATAFDESDAVNYFYEPFLEAYDPDLRNQLGVWYTPREIIRYQVARVDRLLREELGKPLGLADPDVLVLDPATGTGGYPLEVLRVIDATLRANGEGATRALRLRRAATKRVYGFEILPAPFVVAHLQLATLMASLGAPLEPKERAGVYLTNALTGWSQADAEQTHFAGYPRLREEVNSATEMKRNAKILVVLGNPPYNGFAGVAEAEEKDLLAPYYVGLRERFDVTPRAINDLYVRFFRLAERQIAETTGRGIVSFISNNGWLEGLSQPVMRERLLTAFDTIWIDNLNGGGRFKGSRGPDGKPDRSAFEYVGKNALSIGITVSTAITTLVKRGPTAGQAGVWYRDLWGQGQEKRDQLAADAHRDGAALAAQYTAIQPEARARFTLRPGGGEEDYLTWPALPQIFARYFPGVKTSRDADLVSIDREPLAARMRQYFDASLNDARVAEVAPTLMKDASRYVAAATRKELLRTSGFHEDHIVRIAYRPLDDRWLYWERTTKLLDEKRADFFEQVFPGNLYLEVVRNQRKGGQFDHGSVLSNFMDLNYVDGGSRCFPLSLRHQDWQVQTVSSNLRPELMEQMPTEFIEAPDFHRTLFYHISAILNTPAYRHENAGTLERDWPRLPIPAERAALEASARLGQRMADLLRPDMPFTPPPELARLGQPARVDGGQLREADLKVTVRYAGVGRYDAPDEAAGAHGGRLWWNADCFWQNVPPEVWAFTIGGYPVIKKWLDYRHSDKLGRPLRLDEVLYVREMVQRIAALLALGPALDASYAAIKAAPLGLDLARLGKPTLAAAPAGDDEAEA